MTERIQAIRGMNDVLPSDVHYWKQIERTFEHCLFQYGYQEIRFPLLENTLLFKRSIGEVTDVVEKEMYTFNDRNGESLTLRPEGTAGCVRACLEHGLLHNQQQKLWYSGPMFRYEKPQKGRYRQFTQFGVEAFGFEGVTIELELLAICSRIWHLLGLSEVVYLELNTLGELSERQKYRNCLQDYFRAQIDQLDDDSKRRLETNPLRILDSKNPDLKSVIAGAPKLIDFICEEGRQRFQSLCDGLLKLGIPYTINPLLVRGLDYYGGVVFEWVTDKLGSQATICAGGRFDKLVEQIGGSPTPAIGFGIGPDRVKLLMDYMDKKRDELIRPFVFFIATSDAALQQAIFLAEKLRDAFPEHSILVNTAGGGFKSQFKKADKSNARYALILGEEEFLTHCVSVKDLLSDQEQVTLSYDQLIKYLETKNVNLHD